VYRCLTLHCAVVLQHGHVHDTLPLFPSAAALLSLSCAHTLQGQTVRDAQAHLAREFYASATEWAP